MNPSRSALLRELADELDARDYREPRPRRRRVSVQSPAKFRVQPNELQQVQVQRILRAKGIIP